MSLISMLEEATVAVEDGQYGEATTKCLDGLWNRAKLLYPDEVKMVTKFLGGRGGHKGYKARDLVVLHRILTRLHENADWIISGMKRGVKEVQARKAASAQKGRNQLIKHHTRLQALVGKYVWLPRAEVSMKELGPTAPGYCPAHQPHKELIGTVDTKWVNSNTLFGRLVSCPPIEGFGTYHTFTVQVEMKLACGGKCGNPQAGVTEYTSNISYATHNQASVDVSVWDVLEADPEFNYYKYENGRVGTLNPHVQKEALALVAMKFLPDSVNKAVQSFLSSDVNRMQWVRKRYTSPHEFYD